MLKNIGVPIATANRPSLKQIGKDIWTYIHYKPATKREETPAGDRLLYDRKRAAAQLSISVRSLDYLIAGGKLATRRIGKKVMIPHAELVRFAKANHYGAIAS